MLTDAGLLFLDQVKALMAERMRAGKPLLFGCYEKATKQIVYAHGALVLDAPTPTSLLSFSSKGEAHRWEDKDAGEGETAMEGVEGKEEAGEEEEEEGSGDEEEVDDVIIEDADEADRRAAAKGAFSRHLALRVTPDHQMFVQTGSKKGGSFVEKVTRKGPRGRQRPKQPVPHDLVPAAVCAALPASNVTSCDCADEHCDGRHPAVRMLACAEQGFVPATDAAAVRAAVQHRLGLTDELWPVFLDLFGFWLGDGTLVYSSGCATGVPTAVQFQVKEDDCTYLEKTFARLRLVRDRDFFVYPPTEVKVQTLYNVVIPAWLLWFDEEFGRKYKNSDRFEELEDPWVKSVKWLPYWVIFCLPPIQLRLLIEGLRRADGSWSVRDDGKDAGPGALGVFTSGPDFRDQLMQALLHCGFSPFAKRMYVKGDIRGYNRRDTRKVFSVAYYHSLSDEEQAEYFPVQATVDNWSVFWTEPSSSAGKGSCWPSITSRAGIVEQQYDAQRDGPVWCVTVHHPDHLIIAQRAKCDDDGLLTHQSRPVITGNCFGVKDTLAALESGAVEELIVWESLDIARLVLKNKESGAEKVAYMTEKQERDPAVFKEDGVELEVVDRLSLLEWLANNFKSFGAKLQFVTNKSQEGSQFVRGFGGIGGLLRYQLDFLAMEAVDEEEDDFI